jgi:hypothetical protein
MRRPWLAVIALVVIALPSLVVAQSLTIGGRIGWTEGPLPRSDFDPDYSSAAATWDEGRFRWGIRSNLLISRRHGVGVELERMVNTGTLTGSGSFDHLRLSHLLAAFSYEFHPIGTAGRATPFLGAGPTIVRSELESSGFSQKPSLANASAIEESPRDSWSFGVIGYLGERIRLTRVLSVSGIVGTRWSQASRVSVGPVDVRPLNFTGWDLRIGLDLTL